MLKRAAIIQGIGAIAPTFIFLTFVWNTYIHLTRFGHLGEGYRAVFYAPAPLALGLAVPLAMRIRKAWSASRVLTFTYPLVPLFDLITLRSSLHGGEILFLPFALIGLCFSITLWRLLAKGRPALT